MKRRGINTYLLYVVAIVTVLLLTPFIFIFSDKFVSSNINSDAKGDGVIADIPIVNKIYSSEAYNVDLTGLDKKYTVITLKALNENNTLILCSETVDYMVKYDSLRIIVVDKYGNLDISSINISGKFLENVINGYYTYTAYNDNTMFISDNRNGYLIDLSNLKIIKKYRYPSDMDIYEAVISNDKNAIAITSEGGLFLADTDMKNIKELVASVQDINGSVTGPRYPVWSGTDDFIYYTLYTDDTMRFPGRTTLVPGGNETFTSLAGLNASMINGERLFYYQSSSTNGNTSSFFKCGFFDVAAKASNDMINSSVYYFNAKVSQNGSLLAALSYNGMLQKLNIIDPESKQLIYSENIGKVNSFDFSPDERGILVLGESGDKEIIRMIQINWHTVEY